MPPKNPFLDHKRPPPSHEDMDAHDQSRKMLEDNTRAEAAPGRQLPGGVVPKQSVIDFQLAVQELQKVVKRLSGVLKDKEAVSALQMAAKLVEKRDHCSARVYLKGIVSSEIERLAKKAALILAEGRDDPSSIRQAADILNLIRPGQTASPESFSDNGRPWVLCTWNMQGQGMPTSSSKGTALLNLFARYPMLDMAVLQEAGDEAGSMMNMAGMLDIDPIQVPAFNNTNRTEVLLKHSFITSTGNYSTRSASVGVVWYSTIENQDAKNPRCSLAIVYRYRSLFPHRVTGTTLSVADRQHASHTLQGALTAIFYKAEEDKNDGKLRPAIRLALPHMNLSVFNFHGPSTSNRFPTTVALTMLSDFRHLPSVMAGDFNFTPNRLESLDGKAEAFGIQNFDYGDPWHATQQSDGTLDFAMGNVPVSHIPFEILARQKNGSLRQLADEVDAFESLKGDYLAAIDKGLVKLKLFKGKRLRLAYVDELHHASVRQSMRRQLEKEGYQPHAAAKAGFTSDHIPQFFLVREGGVLPPPYISAKTVMEEEKPNQGGRLMKQ